MSRMIVPRRDLILPNRHKQRGFIINPYRFGGGGGGSFLDSLAVQPRAVLSLRKLISTATVAVRVRRSSDNAEQDIGFSGDALDTSALTSFVGANSAYVVTFYDQTGNAEHATQATAANQPRIVNAGTYDSDLVFDGSNDHLAISSLTMGSANAGVYAKLKSPADGAKIICELSSNYTTNPYSFVCYYDSNEGGLNVGMNNDSSLTIRRNSFNINAATETNITALMDRSVTGSGEIACWDAGVSKSPTSWSSTEQSGSFASGDFFIGARSGAVAPANLRLKTLVLYNADTASIRASIEAIVA